MDSLRSLITRRVDPGETSAQLKRILHAVRTHLGMDVGFISEFTDGRRIFRQVECAEGSACIEVGGSNPLEESYCHWVARGRLPQMLPDPMRDSFAAQLPVTRELPVGAHLSVPIRLRDGQVYGTFCCFSFSPDPTLGERDLAVIHAFAEVAAELIQSGLDHERHDRAAIEQIRQIIDGEQLTIVYQPAVRIDRPGIAFVEALSRFHSDVRQPPDRWFAAAARVGLGDELERLAIRLALEGLHQLPANTVMSVNVSPATVLTPGFWSLFDGVALDRVILEITEHDAVESYDELIGALSPHRRRGLRLAVDDTGAGYSSFRHILLLAPDLIKLDMGIARGIDCDPARRALAAALIAFTREIGSELVAEGVETSGELATLRELGVTLVQGHMFSRPGPARTLRGAEQAGGRLRRAAPR